MPIDEGAIQLYISIELGFGTPDLFFVIRIEIKEFRWRSLVNQTLARIALEKSFSDITSKENKFLSICFCSVEPRWEDIHENVNCMHAHRR